MNDALVNDEYDEPPCFPECCHACDICFNMGCRYDEWVAVRKGRQNKEETNGKTTRD